MDIPRLAQAVGLSCSVTSGLKFFVLFVLRFATNCDKNVVNLAFRDKNVVNLAFRDKNVVNLAFRDKNVTI